MSTEQQPTAYTAIAARLKEMAELLLEQEKELLEQRQLIQEYDAYVQQLPFVQSHSHDAMKLHQRKVALLALQPPTTETTTD